MDNEQNMEQTEEKKPKKATLSEMEAKLAEMEARLEAMTKAETSSPTKESESVAEPQAPLEDPWRRVKIKLFKDNDRYKDDVYVSLNGYNATIKRGEFVEIPLFVAKHLEECQAQDEHTAAIVQSLTDQYDVAKNYLN